MKSPFSKIIALGFYDGPEAGVLQCSECLTEYRFEMLDTDFNPEDLDTRIFSLAQLPSGSFDQIVEVCPKVNPPHWPVWMPLWQFPSDDARQTADHRIQEVLDRAVPAELIVAWVGYGDMILAAKRLRLGTQHDIYDWFSFLGLVKSSG